MEVRNEGLSGLLMAPIRPKGAFFLCLFFLTAAMFPLRGTAESGPEEPLGLLVFVSPESPSTDAPLVVTLLVDYPDPAEVTALPPAVPSSVSLVRTRSEPRFVKGRTDRDERWTAVEFTYSIAAVKDFVLGPFKVATPTKRANTEAMAIRVSASQVRRQEKVLPSLRWEELPSSLRAGEAAELLLILSDSKVKPEDALSAEAPENALMVQLPLSPEDRRRGAVGRFRLTALQPPGFELPAVSLALNGSITVRAPGGTIAVSAVPEKEAQKTDAKRSSVPAAKNRVDANGGKGKRGRLPFPGTSAITEPFLTLSEKPLSRARSAWSAADYGLALAALRSAERDTIAGFALAPIRREAERELGIAVGPDEGYAPFSALVVVSLLAALLSLVAFFWRRGVTSGGRGGYSFAILFLALACCSMGRLLFVRMDAAGWLGRGASAISSACVAYRIPEPEGEEAASFAEGEAIRLRSSSESWVYAEARNGRAGWIEGSRAIRY